MTSAPQNTNQTITTTEPTTVRIRTGARLHFGLLDTVEPFGGAGLMIDGFGCDVSVDDCEQFSVAGDQNVQARGKAIAQRLQRLVGWDDLPACRVTVHQQIPPHSGLGSGTQLSLAIAECLATWSAAPIDRGQLIFDVAERGRRSAVGLHGYFQGGLIAEGLSDHRGPSGCDDQGHQDVQRIELPMAWRVVVLMPRQLGNTISGSQETQHFDRLADTDAGRRESLCRLLRDHLLPAANAGSFQSFTHGLESYNYQSGCLFADIQGGAYHGSMVASLVELARRHGGRGVGQSSWGPGVFAFFDTEAASRRFVRAVASDAVEATMCRFRTAARTVDAKTSPAAP